MLNDYFQEKQPNFTSAELDLLLNLIDEKKDILNGNFNSTKGESLLNNHIIQ